MKNIEISAIQSSSCNRRDFIKDIAKGAGKIAFGTFAISYLASCSDDSNPASPNNNSDAEITIDISEPENAAISQIGGTIAINGNSLDSRGMLIIRTSESSVTVLSRRCTHQSCTIPNLQNGISSCPCHGSQFNASGSVVNGPATQRLTEYSAILEGNLITVTS